MLADHAHGTLQRWFKIALFNLLLVATVGVLMRYAFVDEIPSFEYIHWLHAHSHLAILGWVYLALFVLIVKVFIPQESRSIKRYRILFVASLLIVWGMLFAFIAGGYWFLSIGLLVIHVLLSYFFVWTVWRDLASADRNRMSVRLLRMALLFQVISTLAWWTMPFLVSHGLKGTEYYYMAIQYFLHFQFNGWFMFGVLGLFFRFLEEKGVQVPRKESSLFFMLLVVSCFLTYALAVAWSNPLPVIFFINGTGVTIQFLALIVFVMLLYRIRKGIHMTFSRVEHIFIYAALSCLILKIFIQTAVVIPDIAKVGYTIRNFVIGFMHLILLGVITMGIFGSVFHTGLLSQKSKKGAILVLIGFLLVELLLFGQGILFWAELGFMPYYYESLVVSSIFIWVGVLWMLVKRNE